MIGSSANSTPMPKIEIAKKYMLPSATDASAAGETRPTIIVSTTPISIVPTWISTNGAGEAQQRSEIGARRFVLERGRHGSTVQGCAA